MFKARFLIIIIQTSQRKVTAGNISGMYESQSSREKVDDCTLDYSKWTAANWIYLSIYIEWRFEYRQERSVNWMTCLIVKKTIIKNIFYFFLNTTEVTTLPTLPPNLNVGVGMEQCLTKSSSKLSSNSSSVQLQEVMINRLFWSFSNCATWAR